MSDKKTEPKSTGVSNTNTKKVEEISLEELTNQLVTELKKVPQDQLKAAKVQVQDLLGGELKWAELVEWTSEKLHETAKQGYSQYEAGQYNKAEIIFKGLTVLDPDNFYYHQMLGATFQQQRKFPEAIVEYSIALDLKPADMTSLTNRGEVYYELKLWDLADADFDKAISLDPAGENRWANRSRLLKKKVIGIRQMAQQTKSAPVTKTTATKEVKSDGR